MSVFLIQFAEWLDERGNLKPDAPDDIREAYEKALDEYAKLTDEKTSTGAVISL